MYHTQQSYQKSQIAGNEEKVYKRKIRYQEHKHIFQSIRIVLYIIPKCIASRRTFCHWTRNFPHHQNQRRQAQEKIFLRKSVLEATIKYIFLKKRIHIWPFSANTLSASLYYLKISGFISKYETKSIWMIGT